MTDDETEKLAIAVANKLRTGNKDVYGALNVEQIQTLKQMINIFSLSRSFFVKAFLGFAVVGACVLAVVGVSSKFK